MKSYNPTYRCFGESTILIDWPQEIAPDISADVLAFRNAIVHARIDGVLDVGPAYASLIVCFDDSETTAATLTEQLRVLYTHRTPNQDSVKIWHIPVCYDTDYGQDLAAFAKEKKCTAEDVVRWHTQPDYRVYFIGFLPGFLYLGGLDKRLHKTRKPIPNSRIPAGSIGIGGEQTGIYPADSPGGWHIIGRTPLKFYNEKQEYPCFASPGDHLRFFSIGRKEYDRISNAISGDKYKIEFT